ncbi:hypothetical protein pb186bvf_014498 [Paramecium bursaria]
MILEQDIHYLFQLQFQFQMINNKRYDDYKNTYIYTKSINGRKESLKWDDDIMNYDIIKYEMLVSNLILAVISVAKTKLLIRNKNKMIIKRSKSYDKITGFKQQIEIIQQHIKRRNYVKIFDTNLYSKKKYEIMKNIKYFMKQVKFIQPSPKSLKDIVPFPDKDEQNRYWRKFRNVYRSVRLFQSPEAVPIASPNELTENKFRVHSIKFPTSIEKRKGSDEKFTNDAFKYIKLQKELFLQIERGENIQQIQELLSQDPKRYLYDTSNPLRLLNKKNQNGLTPLYIACRNGHLQVCEILLKNGADINQPITLNDLPDYPLAVAIRWKHQEIIQLLLKHKPSKEQIEVSLPFCNDKRIRSHLARLLA